MKIYELRGAMMHAKTACIDGVWSTIGSTNLDWRSFLHNDEINAVVLGRGFATQMETMFADDVAAVGRDRRSRNGSGGRCWLASRSAWRGSARTGCKRLRPEARAEFQSPRIRAAALRAAS